MKKLFSLLAIALVFAACSSEDDSNDTTANLEGTWKLTAFNTENEYDLNEDGTASSSVMDETSCYQNETITFNADGTGTVTSRSYADIELNIVTGTTDSYEYTITCVEETESSSFVYEQNGNTVTVTEAGEDFDVTVSGNTITFVVPNGFFLETEGSGSGTAQVTEDITFVYTKQ